MSVSADSPLPALRADAAEHDDVVRLRAELHELLDDRQRMRCMASIQSDAVQLALDLLVAHPDLRGFFRGFIKRLVDESGAHACGVWLPDENTGEVDLWMANVGDESIMADSPEWHRLGLPREALNRQLASTAELRTTLEYAGDDPRLTEDVRAFNRERGIDLLLIAPLRLAEKNLGWLALASPSESECDRQWRRALLDATARQATLALYYSRLVDRSLLEARRQAVLEERNSIARDIHDTLAQGFGAILMHLQAARRAGDAQLPGPVARNLDTAIELARRHLVDARRSVAALRPQSDERADVGKALADMVDFAKRTCDVPLVELRIDQVPILDAGVGREIIGIAQEALTNATRHARARRIVVTAGAVRGVGFRLSVADDGRGMSGDCQLSGFGLTSMRERAERIGASLTFVTAPRAGTEVVLAWQPASFSIPRSTHAQH